MQLKLNRLDLAVEYRGILPSVAVEAKHFERSVQRAIQVVGSAEFNDGYGYQTTIRKQVSTLVPV